MIVRDEAAFAFWRRFGERPVCLAPMVDVCDLPFRLLVRRHGVHVCWTGMINANQWNMSRRYRKLLQLAECDRPLVCQISGPISSDLVSAARSVASYSNCVAVDVNLGCCMSIAKRGDFGYFMVETEAKRRAVIDLIRNVASSLSIPLFAKIRAIEDDGGAPSAALTVQFARALEHAGVKLITVHGRPRRQGKEGDVDFELIRSVVASVGIPVIANGGITSREMANAVLTQTAAAGVMAGRALLRNPRLFDCEGGCSAFGLCREYLELAREYHGEAEPARRHMFSILETELGSDSELKGRLGQCHSLEHIAQFLADLEGRHTPPV